MATKAEQFKNEVQRSKAPRPKQEVKASRSQRAAAAEGRDFPPTRSAKGSEHARQMKGETPAARHVRRGG